VSDRDSRFSSIWEILLLSAIRRLTFTTGFLTLVSIGSLAQAEKPAFGETFMFSLGGMEHRAKATFQSTREGRPPIELDMNDLGMDPKTTTFWAGVAWQFADSWGLSASYSGFRSDGLVSTTEDGNFGDIDWSVNTTLDSELDLDLFIIDLHWDFLNTERTHLGIGLGLHIADISTGIDATLNADINGQPLDPPVDLGNSAAAVTAPLPNIFVRGGHRFGDSFYLLGTLGYFDLKVDDIEGELITARAALEWRPGAGRFGVGVGYQFVDMVVAEESDERFERYDMEFYGPVLFVGVGF